MTNPAKNRLHDYEAGWLTLLVEMGVATEAMRAVAMLRRHYFFGQFGVRYHVDRKDAASQPTVSSHE
jgi:hypothetical protein